MLASCVGSGKGMEGNGVGTSSATGARASCLAVPAAAQTQEPSPTLLQEKRAQTSVPPTGNFPGCWEAKDSSVHI